MNKNDLYNVISGIDENYLSRSENFSDISAEFRYEKSRRIVKISSACGCSVIIALYLFLVGNSVFDNKFASENKTAASRNTKTEIISDLSSASDSSIRNHKNESDVYKNSEASDMTENDNYHKNAPTSENDSKSSEISDSGNIVNYEKTTDIQTDETGDVYHIGPQKTHTDIPFDSDGITLTDFSEASLDEWLSNSSVVWGEKNIKGSNSNEQIALGSTKISDPLSNLMQIGNPDTIYAVTADFSACINEDEMRNWEYNGNTISELEKTRSDIPLAGENEIVYSDMNEQHTERYPIPADEEQYTELTIRINEIKYAYYQMKIQSFTETFKNNGLGIYTSSWATSEQYFYTFENSSNFENFLCSDYEAFIFYPAGEIK